MLSGKKGFPAIVYAIKKLALGIHMAATEKLNIIIKYADIKTCYPSALNLSYVHNHAAMVGSAR